MTISVPILLMVGGLAMRSAEFLSLSQLLTAQGVNTVYFDNLFVGSGPRPNDISSLTIKDQASHQWNMLDQMGLPKTEKISIFGISMGGMIAAAMVAQRPQQVARVILAATSPNLTNNPALTESLANEWIAARTPDAIDKAVTIAFGTTCLTKRRDIKDAYLRYRLSMNNQQTGREFAMQVNSIRSFPGEEYYNIIRCAGIPVSIISGDEDALFPASHTENMAHLLPNAHSVFLKNTGHMLHLENERGLCEAILAGMAK